MGQQQQQVTSEQVWEEVERLAAESPDFVYEKPIPDSECLYTYDGQPSCLVGHALVACGIPVDVIAHWEAESGPDCASAVMHDLGIRDNGFAVRIDKAQVRQDTGMPWGQAVI